MKICFSRFPFQMCLVFPTNVLEISIFKEYMLLEQPASPHATSILRTFLFIKVIEIIWCTNVASAHFHAYQQNEKSNLESSLLLDQRLELDYSIFQNIVCKKTFFFNFYKKKTMTEHYKRKRQKLSQCFRFPYIYFQLSNI